MLLSFFWFSNSEFIYKLTRAFRTIPANALLKNWDLKLSEKLGIVFNYTDRIGNVFVNRANHV